VRRGRKGPHGTFALRLTHTPTHASERTAGAQGGHPSLVGRPVNMDASTVGEIDGWIEKLYNCKPLSEQEIRRLCEKVRPREGPFARLDSLALAFVLHPGRRVPVLRSAECLEYCPSCGVV